MKNLTRVLALVLALSLVLGTVAFASFTDVKAGDDYAEAIETLAALGIIKGYEDGSFGAEKAITRAEAVAIVNRIKGLEKAAAGAASASLYTDVAADHWALGDINLATQMGVVSGDGNGKFRPEDQVSYQEMVKMLVCALNYQPAVEDLGGWPTGYLVAAQTYGVLEDTANLGAAPANRGIVAQLTFNTLTAPLMVQEGFGTNKTYKVKDEEGKTETLLSENLKIYKVAAEVTATDKDDAKVGYAKIKLENKTAATYEVKKPSDLNLNQEVVVGDSTIGEKKGYTVVAYLQKNADKEWVVLYNTVEEGTNIEETVLAADIEAVKTATKKYVSVVDADENETKYYINKETKVYVNGEVVKKDSGEVDGEGNKIYVDITGEDVAASTFNYAGSSERRDGSVTFYYKNKNDDYVSKIFIEEWLTDVVDEIAPNGKSIFLKYGAPIKLDTELNEDLVYTITMDDKAVEITDLKEDDVVTYIKANGGNFYNIFVSRATVEGAVDAYYDDEKLYTIAGNDYEVSQSAKVVAGGDLGMKGASMAGTSGVFFLDAFGKVAGFNRTYESKGAVNYGLILSIKSNYKAHEAEPEFALEATARMLTKDGIADVDFADNVYVTTVKSGKDELVADKVKYEIGDPDKYEAEKGAKAFAALIAPFVGAELIDYTVNSDGKISAISYYTGAAEAAGLNDYITFNAELKAETKYDERNSKLGKYTVDANTVIFYVAGDKEDYTVTDTSFLEDEYDYVLEGSKVNPLKVYGMNEDRVAGALLITKEVQSADLRGNVAVYVKYATIKDEEDQSITQVTYYQGGELKTINAETVLDMSTYAAGDVVLFDINTKGLLVDIDTIADQKNTKSYGFTYPELSKDAKYVYGEVVGKNGKVLKVAAVNNVNDGTNEWENHTIAEDAKVYIVERKANGKINVTTGAVAEITKNMFYGEKGPDATVIPETDPVKYVDAYTRYDVEDADNFTVLLKYIEGDVIDVVVYKNFLGVESAK